MTPHWEPALTDAEVRFLLTPAKSNAEADALRENIYLRLRVRLRGFVRRGGLVVEEVRESCVDLTVMRARSEFVEADAAELFASGGELAWVFNIGAEVAPQCVEENDADFVRYALQNGAGDVAASIDPRRKVQKHEAEADHSLTAVFDCVRQAVGRYLASHRQAIRQENVAMYLRYTFSNMRHKELASLYNRTPEAVNNRICKTRRELTDAAKHCYSKEGTR